MATPGQCAALAAHIRTAFASSECPPADRIALHQCDECDELRAALVDTRWDAIPDALIEVHANALPLLSPEAFAYFLPAYLLYALDHLTSQATPSEMTVYAVGPNKAATEADADWHRERLKTLTHGQGAVVEQFLALVEADADLGAYIGDVAERRARFRALWESRWSA